MNILLDLHVVQLILDWMMKLNIISIHKDSSVSNSVCRLINVYIKKSIGPKIDPCGTPDTTGRGLDSAPSIALQTDFYRINNEWINVKFHKFGE